MPEYILMKRATGRLKRGDRVRVLGPKDPIKGRCVDADKAQSLIEQGFAKADDEQAAKARRKRKVVKRG